MKKNALKIAAVASIVMVSGCATILNDETQNVNILSSNGEKFSVSINGMPFDGPGIAKVTRAKDDVIIISKTEGCAEQTLLASSVDPKFFINILSGGAFGSSTDYSSDEMWKYDNSVTVNCK